jgi:hypothetical protein
MSQNNPEDKSLDSIPLIETPAGTTMKLLDYKPGERSLTLTMPVAADPRIALVTSRSANSVVISDPGMLGSTPCVTYAVKVTQEGTLAMRLDGSWPAATQTKKMKVSLREDLGFPLTLVIEG